jgi:hypothetical protein
MFSDNIESGINGFAAYSMSPTVLWHQVEDGVDSCPNSNSATHSWWYGQDSDCTYDNGWENGGELYSPLIPTCSAKSTTATLSFWSWEDTECNDSFGCTWDSRWVYASTDGGSNWDVVWASDNLTYDTWYLVSVPITGITPGIPIQLMFYFATYDDIANDYGAGI